MGRGEKRCVYSEECLSLAKEIGLREEGSYSKENMLKSLWKGIWKIKGASVVKTFMWQACNNILPTKEMLYKRKIDRSRPFMLCGLTTETVGHILWIELSICQRCVD